MVDEPVQIRRVPVKLFEGIISYEAFNMENPYIGPVESIRVEFYRPEFLVDFGPWKKGERPYDLNWDPHSMMLTEGDCFQYAVKSVKLKLVPE